MKNFLVRLIAASTVILTLGQVNHLLAANENLHNEEINLLRDMGIVRGVDASGEFDGGSPVTREQFAQMMYRMAKKGNEPPILDINPTSFKDLEDATYFHAIGWASANKIIVGTAPKAFEPTGGITKQDAATMIMRFLGYKDLNYPYGFIEQAESKNIELFNKLEDVPYEAQLNREQCAQMIYNALFAEMNKTIKTQEEYLIGGSTWVLRDVEKHPNLLEEIYDAIEAEYQVVATDESSSFDYSYDVDFDGAKLIQISKTDAPYELYVEESELRFKPSVLCNLKVLLKVDKDDNVTILSATPLGTATKVTDMVFAHNDKNNAAAYYLDSSTATKRLNGKVRFNGSTDAYFYNAPYNYIKPSYAPNSSEAEKYAARNANDVKVLRVERDEDGKVAYKLDADFSAYDYVDEYCAQASEDFIDYFLQAYLGGKYSATIYDVDGDGIVDYLTYQPYYALIADTNKSHSFESDGATATTIYTYDAEIEGVSFKDGDMIVCYFDQDANYIYVDSVIKPTIGSISATNKSNRTVVIKNRTYSINDAYKYFANYTSIAANDLSTLGYNLKNYKYPLYNALLTPAVKADDVKFYIYNSTIIYQDGISTYLDFDEMNTLILIPDEKGVCLREGAFNNVTGDAALYARAYTLKDGKIKYIQLDTDEDVDYNDFVNKLCIGKSDKNGIYTLELYSDYENVDLTSDDEGMAYISLNKTALTQIMSNRYKAAGLEAQLVISSDSIIVIKTIDEDGEEIFSTLSTLGFDNELKNVHIVLSNNTKYSNRENVVFFYGETDEEIAEIVKTKNTDLRIVKDVTTIVKDEKTYNEYTLINPYTGATIEATGAKANAKAFNVGDLVSYTSGKVQETSSKGTIFDASNCYWIVDYDPEDNVIEVTKDLNSSETLMIYLDDTKFVKLIIEDDEILDAKKLSTFDIDSKTNKSYNSHVKTDKGTIKTYYAKYPKAYLIIYETDEKGYDGEIDCALILISDGENVENCDLSK